ncbi:hypothetical protein [Spiroplasma endosymbiont of Notiophilus biguttatus]|uniref:hypothetical protein n=1 Tax=Spiroplasma endosymbiont of Notiophilus biguttatus TaxID=3066285 RepID=UPI00313D7745
MEGTMKLNEFNIAFQTEQQCLAYIANLKENKCIRCSSFNLNTSDLKRILNVWNVIKHLVFSRVPYFQGHKHL